MLRTLFSRAWAPPRCRSIYMTSLHGSDAKKERAYRQTLQQQARDGVVRKAQAQMRYSPPTRQRYFARRAAERRRMFERIANVQEVATYAFTLRKEQRRRWDKEGPPGRKPFERHAREMRAHVDDAIARTKLRFPKGGAADPYW